jgi:phosphoribosylpyrophosphate synthetase
LYNEAYRKKKEEEKEKMMKRIENARRREQERLEQERLEQERLEQERLEQKRQEAERKRREQELQRQREAERQKREISELKDCTASWFRSNRSTVPYFPLYYYYPTTCGWDVDEDDWTVRNLIWDFKANPNRPQSDAEIKRRHETSASCVLPDFEKLLRKTFGGKISQLTLVCIPSSKRVVYERRCRDFSSSLCSRLGLANGYNYVSVVADGEAKHISGASTAEFSVDGNFFRGRKVLLFDDVLTTGASMEKFKRLLEGVGATVIAGICIGVTTHSPQFGEPKNRI